MPGGGVKNSNVKSPVAAAAKSLLSDINNFILIQDDPGYRLQFAYLVDNDSWTGQRVPWSWFSLCIVHQSVATILSHGHTSFDLGCSSVSGMDSPDALWCRRPSGSIPSRVGVAPNDPPMDDHRVPLWSVGNICSQEGPRVCIWICFGTTHTCLALVVGHASSHDVMGFEGWRSKVQSIRLD